MDNTLSILSSATLPCSSQLAAIEDDDDDDGDENDDADDLVFVFLKQWTTALNYYIMHTTAQKTDTCLGLTTKT